MIGRIIASRYQLESRLGSGAMGHVYRARHLKINRLFALKLLHTHLLANPEQRKRFRREAELAGTLSHPNVVGVVDVGETEDGLHYIVMQLASRPTLGDVMSAGPLGPPRVIGLVKQLCAGLHHAHERGLIHRDFKPDNVIVETDEDGRETPRIVDFGVAIVRDHASSTDRERLTTAGLALGTPHYMAPENVGGEPIDHRVDLFALGIVVYEMLTGVMPFDGAGVDVARANRSAETPAMAKRAPGVPVDPLLEAFTRRLMAKAPADRPSSAKLARDLLDAIVKDPASAAAILGVDEPVRVLPLTSTNTPPHGVPLGADTAPASSAPLRAAPPLRVAPPTIP
nr:protein kinase [Myxococcota bacterium]